MHNLLGRRFVPQSRNEALPQADFFRPFRPERSCRSRSFYDFGIIGSIAKCLPPLTFDRVSRIDCIEKQNLQIEWAMRRL